jgi:hypothetical membrane protein
MERASTNGRALWIGAIAWASSVQFFVMQAVVQSAWTTPFSLAQNFISDLGNTTCGPYGTESVHYVCSPWHAWMNASFIVLGLGIVLGAALVRAMLPTGRMRSVGLALVALAGPGLIVVGFFPENVNLPIHALGAADQFIIGNLGMVVLGVALVRDRWWRALGAYSIVSGIVGLVATALFVAERFLGLGIGGMERLAAYPLPLWLTVIGVWLIRALVANPAGSYPHRTPG